MKAVGQYDSNFPTFVPFHTIDSYRDIIIIDE